ncbi:antibiotic biosynthesis monooxygenase [Calditrichota bacterium]
MITRIWHGTTKKEYADEYLNYLREIGIQDYRSISGNISAKILRRIENNICHFWTVTEWENIESIKKYSGENYERARYYPDDKKYLLEFEETVIHCETFPAL